MPPAARLTDMHVCPMQTPAVVPIPHVGGPIIAPGAPTVLIGSMPAARITDMCVCVGPPDVIVRGSAGVYIMGLNAARIGDNTAHGGVIVQGWPTVIIGEIGVVTPTPPAVPGMPALALPDMPGMPKVPQMPAMPDISVPDAGLLATIAKATLDLPGPALLSDGTSAASGSPAAPASAPPAAPSPSAAAPPQGSPAESAPAAMRAAMTAVEQVMKTPASPFADAAVPTLAAFSDRLADLPAASLPPAVQDRVEDLREGVARAKEVHKQAATRMAEIKARAQAAMDDAKRRYEELVAEKKRIESRVSEGRQDLDEAIAGYEATRADLKRQVDEAERLGKALSKEAKDLANRKPPAFPFRR